MGKVEAVKENLKPEVEVTKQLLTKLAEARFEKLDAAVVNAAKRGIIDGLGVAIAGSITTTGQIIRDYAVLEGGNGNCALIGDQRRCAPALSALANGTIAHALDFDDVQWQMIGHPTVCVVPAALALGEEFNKAGRDLIMAYAVGIETAAKIGAGVNPHHTQLGWHGTGVLGTLGATMGASKMLGHDVGQMRNALGIAVSRAAGCRENFGTDTKPFHVGSSAFNGVVAARLTGMGFTANTQILEAPWGFFTMYCGGRFDAEKILSQATNPWSVLKPGLLFKPYAACVSTHTAIDSILGLIAENDIKADDVVRIDVGVVKLTQDILIHTRPKTGLNGKFSMQYCMARALLSRNLGIRQFTDEKVQDAAAQELLRRVDWHVDPELEAAWKGGPRPETVHLYMKDGRKLTRRTDKSKGNPEVPMTDEEITEKFKDCASSCLPPRQVNELVERLWDLENVESVRDIAKLLTTQS
jgi:2-methylcitrate dehydratase PrpD